MVATVSNGSAVAMLVVCAFVSASVGVMVACALSRRSRRRRVFETALRLDLVDDSTDPDQLLASIERSLRDARVDALEEREHTARLQLALESMAEAVLVYDTDGVMLEHNASAAQYIDARHGDALVGAAIGDLVRVSLSGEAASTTLELFGPPRRWVVLTTTPVATDSGPVVVAMVEDITERRLLEAMRTDFVANISHELKTPVGAIALLAETLEVENDSVVAERLAGRIHVEALRVGRTIEDLLELSRIESATAHPDRRVDLCEIIGEAVTRLRPAAEQAGVEFAVTISEQVPLTVAGDRRQLQSAVTNLLDNAVKYSDPGSSVDVVADVDGDRVRVTIADHGIGIPARDLERIFERFYRVDQARSRATGGTGLGLSIVRHIVSNHGGTIEVDSRLGEGSAFTLDLPRAVELIDSEPTATDRAVPTNRS